MSRRLKPRRGENEGSWTFVDKIMKNDRKNIPNMPKCRFGYGHCDFKLFNILVNTCWLNNYQLKHTWTNWCHEKYCDNPPSIIGTQFLLFLMLADLVNIFLAAIWQCRYLETKLVKNFARRPSQRFFFCFEYSFLQCTVIIISS